MIIVGGGIAGSITAKYAAQGGLKTLLIEKEKTPREKPCSGIQFPYFERILGEKIPRDRLCNVELNKVKMYLPNGESYSSPFKMLNFMRKPFDDWLNKVAKQHGAEFIDECNLRDITPANDHVQVDLQMKNGESQRCEAKYVVDASGLRSNIRMKLRPGDFQRKSMGATLNYYVDGTGELDVNTLYQFWNLDWCDGMFAWVYTKTLDDGKDYWVVGTGCSSGRVLDRHTLFYDYITKEFHLDGVIVKKEGYSHSVDLSSKDRVWLGEGRVLAVGDAAGLIDQTRGVGMDSAALSGRLAAQALVAEGNAGVSVHEGYVRLMGSLVDQTRRNQGRDITGFKSNEELQRHLESTLVKTGVEMFFQSALNRLRPLSKMVMLPP